MFNAPNISCLKIVYFVTSSKTKDIINLNIIKILIRIDFKRLTLIKKSYFKWILFAYLYFSVEKVMFVLMQLFKLMSVRCFF